MAVNAVVGQSGGPTSVINATLLGVGQTALRRSRIDTVLGMRYGIEGFLRKGMIDFSKEPSQGLERLRYTPSSVLGSCRYKPVDEDLPEVLELFRAYDVKYYFMIGGNDTMDTIHRIEAYCRRNGYEVRCIGAPKTVDNDLYGTDHTPGYPSAARYVALSVMQSGRLARDMKWVDRFVVHQTIGRDAGWLAASSAVARRKEGDAPHLIYLPERPLRKNDFLTDVKRNIDELGWVYIIVGEGAVWEDGTPVSAARNTDGFSNVEFGAMGGASAALTMHRIISDELGLRGEFQIPESLPMCGSDRLSPVDVDEAWMCGRKAVEYALNGNTGEMVSIRRVRAAGPDSKYEAEYGTTPLEEVAARAKPMPASFLDVEKPDVSRAFIDYVEPLVGELPEYGDLEQNSLELKKEEKA